MSRRCALPSTRERALKDIQIKAIGKSDREYLNELVHLIIYNSKEHRFRSSVKLNKTILYFNVEYAKQFAKPFIELTYIRKPQGPICYELKETISLLETKGMITRTQADARVNKPKGHNRKKTYVWEYKANTIPDFKMIDANTLMRIYSILESHKLTEIKAMTAQQASKFSHKKGEGHGEVWRNGVNNEILPLVAYLTKQESVTQADIDAVMEELKDFSLG